MCAWKVRTADIPWCKIGVIHSEDMDMPEKDCPELIEKTVDAIDDASLQELFVSTQMNNINLCVKFGLK